MRIWQLRGVHFSVPLIFRRYATPTIVKFTCKFTESCKYYIEGENMYDWNKLCGLKALYFTPRFDTAMCGWRYDQFLNCFEVIPYWHIGSKEHTFDEKNVMRIPVDTEFTVEFRVISTEVYKETIGVVKIKYLDEITESKTFSKYYPYFWVVNSWFGGQENAPKTMNFFIKRIKLL